MSKYEPLVVSLISGHITGLLHDIRKILKEGPVLNKGLIDAIYKSRHNNDSSTDGTVGGKSQKNETKNWLDNNLRIISLLEPFIVPLITHNGGFMDDLHKALDVNGENPMSHDEEAGRKGLSNGNADGIPNGHQKREQIDDILTVSEKLVHLMLGRYASTDSTLDVQTSGLDNRDWAEDSFFWQIAVIEVATLVHFDGFVEDLKKILANAADTNVASNEVDYDDFDRSALESISGLHKRDWVTDIEAVLAKLNPLIPEIFGGSGTRRSVAI